MFHIELFFSAMASKRKRPHHSDLKRLSDPIGMKNNRDVPFVFFGGVGAPNPVFFVRPSPCPSPTPGRLNNEAFFFVFVSPVPQTTS
jgi:hypothetical protein